MTEMTESFVTVWEHKKYKGWEDGGDPSTLVQHDVVQLIAALEAIYNTDAHFVPYFIEGESSAPRINKSAIKDRTTGELADGRTMLYSALVFDVDMPSEVKDDEDAQADWADEQCDLIETLPDEWLDTHGFYATRGGYRLIWRLPAPLPPAAWDDYRQRMTAALTAHGIMVDPATKDLTRCYRLPRVVRDGVQQDHGHDFDGLANVLDLSTIPKSVPSNKSVTDHSVFAGIEKAGPKKFKLSEGGRNDEMMSCLGWFRDRGLDADQLKVVATAFNSLNDVPLLEDEVDRCIKQAVKWTPTTDINTPTTVSTVTDSSKQLATAKWFLTNHFGRSDTQLVYDEGWLWRYEPSTGAWELWEGHHTTQLLGHMDSKLKYQTGVDAQGQPKYKKIHWQQSDTKAHHTLFMDHSHRKGFFKDAPHVVAFNNGVVDASLNYYDHNRDFRQRYKLAFDWDPAATCPAFDKFLSEVVSPECGQLIKEWIGVALLGQSPSFAKALMLVGEGANGKSTLLDVVSAMIPDEFRSALTPQALAKDSNYALARLAGRRINLVNEVDDECILKSGAIKAIFSGDEITARNPYEKAFEYRPCAGHVFAANSLPAVRDQSDGFWRRWIVVPFERTFKKHEQDRTLGDKLAAELPGIAKACLEAGAAALKRTGADRGYSSSPAAEKTLHNWRFDTDRVKQYLAERTEIVDLETEGNKACVGCRTMYKDFVNYCSETGVKHVLQEKKFFERVRREGFEMRNTNKGYKFPLKLKPMTFH